MCLALPIGFVKHTKIVVFSGCSADGSALGSGPRGRGFKSRHSDHLYGSISTLLIDPYFYHFYPILRVFLAKIGIFKT